MSKIEIKITLNNGQRLDKGAAAAAFMRYLAQLGVWTDGGKVSSLGSQHKFKARGVTGMDLGTTASATYRPAAEPDGQGELMIQVFSDPGGEADALAPSAPEAVKMSQSAGRNAAHCLGADGCPRAPAGRRGSAGSLAQKSLCC